MSRQAKDPNAPPKFTLTIIGDDEDIPRRVEAFGKHSVLGQVVMVLGQRSLLACVRADGAHLWRGEDWTAPGTPSTPTDAQEIVALIKGAKQSTPTKGAKTLNGTWKGYLGCEGGLMGHLPTVVLFRKIASYGVLYVESHVNGWTYRFERSEKWFTKAGTAAGGEPVSTFPVALQRGLAAAMGLVQEACGIRDTRSRKKIDPDYALLHPSPVRPEREIPLDTRLRAPAPKPPKAPKAPKEPKAPRAPKPPKAPSTRAPSPYMVWAQPWIAAARAADPNLSMKDAMKAAGAEWQRVKGSMPAAPKQPKAAAAPKQPKQPKAAAAPKQPKQPKQPKAGGPAVDPEKDKLLLAGFASSLRDVLGLGAQG